MKNKSRSRKRWKFKSVIGKMTIVLHIVIGTMSHGQYYPLTMVCGYIVSLLAALLSGYTAVFNLISTILTNVEEERYVKAAREKMSKI